MRILVTASSGNIGSKLTSRLLDAGANVTLIARNPQKVAAFKERGAAVAQGSLADQGFVTDVMKGMSAVFWLTPPNSSSDDFRGYQRRLGAIAAEAIEVSGVPRVVNLSSVGAQHGHSCGPVNGLHDVEQAINAAAPNVTHLRPGAFMENYLGSVGTIRTASSAFLPVAGSARIPTVATRDIADAAARVILDGSWTGQRVMTVFGPQELSFDEMASTVSSLIGRPVKHVPVTPEQARESLVKMGIGEDMARQYVELYQSFESGFITRGLPPQPDMRGPTTFAQFARELILPALSS
ncbi:MAG: NmrA family NAD(P)-binding protein [Candidatus Eisenbacteria bacterium]|jgi:uncharacterized protein YbjT (DUF2867 family)|nr:NmrA family NAD(P)-binding protein [Candidatus Eisenbacteria bacterium]